MGQHFTTLPTSLSPTTRDENSGTLTLKAVPSSSTNQVHMIENKAEAITDAVKGKYEKSYEEITQKTQTTHWNMIMMTAYENEMIEVLPKLVRNNIAQHLLTEGIAEEVEVHRRTTSLPPCSSPS